MLSIEAQAHLVSSEGLHQIPLNPFSKGKTTNSAHGKVHIEKDT